MCIFDLRLNHGFENKIKRIRFYLHTFFDDQAIGMFEIAGNSLSLLELKAVKQG